ncbi:hypothetical protein [Calothrix sp. UHCC 0171]|uniref:hypothetical protein n=1 Tax=Calothrix sp. UHCC 0171 TaxID=3110245 RepID=UPI002B20D57C|nr:hypothetical protein [Calothrix sp. UHCC 0171]MEA5574067.1 hypothetical protein [Calothrix sp. UHCC 0171]
MDFSFNNSEQQKVYLEALSQAIPCVTEESKEYLAVITAELHNVMKKEYLLQEEVNRYRVVMDLLNQRARYLDNERRHAERILRQQIALRKEMMITEADISEIVTKVSTVFLKFIPSDKQLSAISELRTLQSQLNEDYQVNAD